MARDGADKVPNVFLIESVLALIQEARDTDLLLVSALIIFSKLPVHFCIVVPSFIRGGYVPRPPSGCLM